MATTVKVGVSVDSQALRSTLAMFRGLPKEANRALRERTQELTQVLATRMASNASSDSPQSALVAGTVKAKKDRVPVITLGGAKRVGRNSAPAHKILFGSEFGSSLPQFRPHLGRGSYWAFRTFEEERDEFLEMWQKVGRDVAEHWSRGGA